MKVSYFAPISRAICTFVQVQSDKVIVFHEESEIVAENCARRVFSSGRTEIFFFFDIAKRRRLSLLWL